MSEINIKAYAKINLSLDVLGKRNDGYHDLATVMQTVSLSDNITVSLRSDNLIKIHSNSDKIPCSENDLTYKAAMAFFNKTGIVSGVDINIEKNIPVSAGLAGGSSDAAAVLKALCILFDKDVMSPEILDAALMVGSDVPFCVTGGCCLAEGRGEILTPHHSISDCHIVIAVPDIMVSTKWVFENLDAKGLKEHPDTKGLISALEDENLKETTVRMYNVLETVSAKKYPVIDKIKSKMFDCGAMGSIMSGSGPSVFGVFDDFEKASYAVKVLETETRHISVSKPV